MNAQERLFLFINEHQKGGCKMLSLGDKCTCPLCSYEDIIRSLKWYGAEAEAIAKNLNKNTLAVEASVAVLNLDAGKRSKA